jgi:hypothetical protein
LTYCNTTNLHVLAVQGNVTRFTNVQKTQGEQLFRTVSRHRDPRHETTPLFNYNSRDAAPTESLQFPEHNELYKDITEYAREASKFNTLLKRLKEQADAIKTQIREMEDIANINDERL